MNNDELLTLKEVADILQVTTDEVGRMIQQGLIKSEQIRGKHCVWRNDVPLHKIQETLLVDKASASRYVGESESTLVDMFKKGQIKGEKRKGQGYFFEFKDLYRYLHFTKKLKD